MLDFGTDMEPRSDMPENDDLFNTIPAAAEPVEKENHGTAAPAGNAEPKRTFAPVKPPVLPQYKPAAPDNAPQKIQPVLRDNPHFLHRKRKAEEFSDEDKQEVSRILKASRNNANLTLEDVENATLIRHHYLVALEEADYNALPSPVFVLAYLRKLCRLYDLSPQEEEQLVRPWRNIPCELPENLPAAVQMDPEKPNQKVLHQLEIALLSFGALLISAIVVLLVVWAVSFFSGKDVPELSFDNTRLLELQEKPALQIPGNN